MPIAIAFALLSVLPVQPSATLFENDQVKIIRALEKPHVPGHFHEHKMNRVMIYLQSGTQRFEYQDGRKPEVFEWKAGDVKWSPAGGMHSPEVTSDQPFNIIEIELKNKGTAKPVQSKLDPLSVDPKHYKIEFENDQVRVFRAKIEPHGQTPMHEHPLNRVTVFLTDQTFRVTDQQGKVTTAKHKAGEPVWATPAVHREENLSEQAFEVIAVEIK